MNKSVFFSIRKWITGAEMTKSDGFDRPIIVSSEKIKTRTKWLCQGYMTNIILPIG